MTVFSSYSAYYDLLYKDKDYKGEVEYVSSLINRVAPSAKSMLELGCGTGIHAELLAKCGWRVHGIDLSETMLKESLSRRDSLPVDLAKHLSFEVGDVRNYSCADTFDAVISLFHVASYQAEDNDLECFVSTAATHLRDGGVFVFDFWYGPAVLTEKPTVRIKRLEDEHIRVLRIAEPVLHSSMNRVDVNYQIMVSNLASGALDEIVEVHPMRYLFLPEVASLLKRHGFSSCTFEEWMTGREPSLNSWGVCVVATK